MEQLPELIITQQPETCTRLKDLYVAIQQRCARLAEGRSSRNEFIHLMLQSEEAIPVHNLMEYRPSQPIGLQKLIPIIKTSRILIRMQNRNSPNTKAIFDLIEKLNRQEVSYLSWLEYAQASDFAFPKMEKRKSKIRSKQNRFISTSGLEQWDQEEQQQQIKAKQLGWPCIKLAKHSRRKTCYLTLDLPFLTEIDKQTIDSIDLYQAESYFLSYLDTQCGINSSDQTITEIVDENHPYISPYFEIHKCFASSHGCGKPCNRAFHLSLFKLISKLEKNKMQRVASVFKNIVAKMKRQISCKTYLELPCPHCDSTLVHLKMLELYPKYTSQQKRHSTDFIRDKINKCKINNGCYKAICQNKQCQYTCCYYCKSPWQKGELNHQEYPDCQVYQKLLEGIEPDEAWLSSQHIVSCKACRDRGCPVVPFTLHEACYVVPCKTCRNEFIKTKDEYKDNLSSSPFWKFNVCISCGENVSEDDHYSRNGARHYPKGPFDPCCNPSQSFLKRYGPKQ